MRINLLQLKSMASCKMLASHVGIEQEQYFNPIQVWNGVTAMHHRGKSRLDLLLVELES